MPSEVSTMQPSITSIPLARAVWIISSPRRIPPHLASLTLTPLTHPASPGTSPAVMALSSAITGTGNAASVTLWRDSGPAETGTGCSIMPTPISFNSVTTSTASSGEKASLASTQRSASDDPLTARSVSTSFHPDLHLQDLVLPQPLRVGDGRLPVGYAQSVCRDGLGPGEPEQTVDRNAESFGREVVHGVVEGR